VRPGEPSISVVVVNWNGRHLLGECLDSVINQQGDLAEVVLVDNGSTDGSSEFVREKYGSRVRLVQLDSNHGWAGGNNRGIEAATGDYVLLLNNDACMKEDFLTCMREGIGRNPGAGMYTPKILNYGDRSVLDNCGHVIYRDGTARGRSRGEKDDERFAREDEVLCPSGAAGVYERRIFERVGPIDERYFAYGEDTDLGLRARRVGYRCLYFPGAVVYHRYSATAGPFTPMKVYYVERNRIWTILKSFPWYTILFSPAFTLFRYFHGLFGLVGRKGAVGNLVRTHSAKDLFLSVARAYRDAVPGIPEMVRKRRMLRRGYRMGDREFSRMLARFSADVREVSTNE
jgi:GT2 family glycosyltransferase